MVNLRSFEVPTVVKHAPGAVACLADQVQALGVKRPMVVTDGGLVKAGIAARVTDVLRATNVDYLLFDGVGGCSRTVSRWTRRAARCRNRSATSWRRRRW